MNLIKASLNWLFIILSLVGCATTKTEKVYRNMAIGALAGAAFGLTQKDNKEALAVMNAGIAASVAGIATLALDSPEKEEIRLRNEVESLKAKLDQVSSPKVAYEGSALFGSRIPSKYKGLVNPGEYKVYELDQWIEDGDNRLVHQDRAVELVPPTLTPNGK